ncbi:serine/threonine protein kinase [Candidatus Woesearchaeota archaeon]|jgi:RIO-like serine/threonine protein kinase|nr:serine/threonine protein kinase [Candidatus Woesearchaeota archaeon]MBT4835444.1 serine/threonine protein kinase [Candidatus Woesearchaeota archaeon]MBT7169621.1 serine/threonine protein kinase [Candidatus Woesearchaeota archaeon]
MCWEKDYIRIFGYEPLKCIGPSSVAVYKIEKEDNFAIAKIAVKSENAQDLYEERERLRENQDLDWMPRIMLYRDYMGSSEKEFEILESFKMGGWRRRNPAILIKEYIPGTILKNVEGELLNFHQYNCVKSQIDEMHSRGYAGLDIVSSNILVQDSKRATLFDLGPSFGIYTRQDRIDDDLNSLDLLVE